MSGKKTTMIHIRITEDEKKDLERLAESKITDLSTMMREMGRIMLKADREHGDRMIWPPQFNYYPSAVLSKQESLLLAAEESDTSYLKKQTRKRAG